MNAETTISIIAVSVSFLALLFSILTYQKGLKRQQKQATLEAYHTLQNEVLDKLNSYTRKQIEEISHDPRSTQYKELSALLARCEHFAVGINSKIYDYTTLRKLAKVYFIGLYEKLLPLIEKKQRISPTERHYAEFETLVTKLKHE